MERYEYQNSGVEWIGDIPKHWRVRKVKRCFNVLLGKMIQPNQKNEDETEEKYLRAANITWEGVDTSDIKSMWFQPFEKLKYKLNHNDLLVSEGGDVGRSSLWKGEVENCYFQNAINRVRSFNNNDTKFLYYWMYLLKSIGYIDAIVSRITIAHLTAEKLDRLPFIVAPLAEQKAIAEYLDRACERIDRIVLIKEKQLEKIEDFFKFRILEATTKGLRNDVKLKPTKSKWVGGVPEHWEIKKIKRLAKVFRGKFTHRPRNDPRFYDGQYPFIQTGNVSKANKYINSYHQTLNELGLSVSEMFPSGTLTMTIAANIADVAILNFDACFPDSIVGFKPNHKLELEYLYYLFVGLRQDFLGTAIVTTQMNLNITRIGDVEGFIPPKSEQLAIINYLNALEIKVSNVKEKVESQIETLKAYRKSLIHECVTGKKQVAEISND